MNELDSSMLNEIKQTVKDKYHIVLFICGIFKKSKLMKQRVEKWLLEAGGVRGSRERLVKREKLSLIK